MKRKLVQTVFSTLVIMCFVVAFNSEASTNYSSCTAINEQMSAQDVSDRTGSISQAYDCNAGRIIVIAKINQQIIPTAVLASVDAFITNYCLTFSKNYLLGFDMDKDLIRTLFKGGVTYVVKHDSLNDQTRTKSLEECLEYAQIMETQLPENPYEQIKFIRQFTPQTERP